MTPEEKKFLNEWLKENGSPYTIDELEATRKRALRALTEWGAQDFAASEAMPQEIKDIKMFNRFAFFTTMAGLFPSTAMVTGMDVAVEAAYNLGKAAHQPL